MHYLYTASGSEGGIMHIQETKHGKLLQKVLPEDMQDGVLLIPARVTQVDHRAFDSLFGPDMVLLDTLNKIKYEPDCTYLKETIPCSLLNKYGAHLQRMIHLSAGSPEVEVYNESMDLITQLKLKIHRAFTPLPPPEPDKPTSDELTIGTPGAMYLLGSFKEADIEILERDSALNKILRVTGWGHLIDTFKSAVSDTQRLKEHMKDKLSDINTWVNTSKTGIFGFFGAKDDELKIQQKNLARRYIAEFEDFKFPPDGEDAKGALIMKLQIYIDKNKELIDQYGKVQNKKVLKPKSKDELHEKLTVLQSSLLQAHISSPTATGHS